MTPRLDIENRFLVGFAVAIVPLLALSPPLLRGVLALGLIAFAPGYAIVRPFRFADNLVVVVSSIAVSLAIATLVSTVLLYGRVWSWPLCAAVLALITAGAAASASFRRSPA